MEAWKSTIYAIYFLSNTSCFDRDRSRAYRDQEEARATEANSKIQICFQRQAISGVLGGGRGRGSQDMKMFARVLLSVLSLCRKTHVTAITLGICSSKVVYDACRYVSLLQLYKGAVKREPPIEPRRRRCKCCINMNVRGLGRLS